MTSIFALFNMGGMEIVLIFAIIVLLFGAKKLPGLARGIGQSIKEFKKGVHEDEAVKDKVPAPKD
jgi:sec-independent protein translocase protein TatA